MFRGSGDAVVLGGEGDVCRAVGDAVGVRHVGSDVFAAGALIGLGMVGRSGEGLGALVAFCGDELLELASRGMSNDDEDDDGDVNDKDDGNERGSFWGVIGAAPLEVPAGMPEGPGETESRSTFGGDLGASGGDLGGGCTSARVIRRPHSSWFLTSSSGDDTGS